MKRHNLISRKKLIYPVSVQLQEYLQRYGRFISEGIRYDDLQRYETSVALYDETGTDTLWSTVYFRQSEMKEIHDSLILAYVLLKARRDAILEHLYIDRIDICLYANTLPFRVRVVNRLNDNFDYFYVKKVDASRIYGLELEHLLSPNYIHYYINADTIVEEHIIGIPADIFFRENMPDNRFDQVRIAKEFVKFNERCFVRLLGDMHSGNFVIDITRDFEKWHFRMRSIDFDQQSYHWRKKVYLPQFFPQNNPIVKVGLKWMTPETVSQYQREERALMNNRLRVTRPQVLSLMHAMRSDHIAPFENVRRLREALADHYSSEVFLRCETMGDVVFSSIRTLEEQTTGTESVISGSAPYPSIIPF